MHHLLAQHDFEVVLKNLLPLVPYVSGGSCEEGTKVLVRLLGEALEAQEAASRRADELKKLKPRGLMDLFTPEKGRRKHHDAQVSPPQSAVAASKAELPEKRPRKVSEKVAGLDAKSKEQDTKAKEGVKRPKERASQGLQGRILQPNGPWDGEMFPRIVKVNKCDVGEDGVRVEVHAKKQGRGQWQETVFTLDAAQLASIANLPDRIKETIKASFQTALTDTYGANWPDALVAAFSGMAWARDLAPSSDLQAPNFRGTHASVGALSGE